MSNSRFILSGGSDGLLMLWDIKSKSSTKIIEVELPLCQPLPCVRKH